MPKRRSSPPPGREMPNWIPPCLPTLVGKPPEGAQWQHEIKWDGYRVSAYLVDGRATIRTRNGHDRTARFRAITDAVAALPLYDAVIDGEGNSSFPALQAALRTGGRGPGQRQADKAILYAFDLLWLDGHDLRPWALQDRRDALLGTIGEDCPVLRFSAAWDATGAALFTAAAENGLEGVVSKRLDLPYRSASTNKAALGAVHIAAEEDGKLRYACAVGSGFSVKAA